MPVPTAGLADVGAADLEPPMPLRRLEQRHQQLPVASLERGPLGKRPAGVGDTVGELVTDALELSEVEDARSGSRGLDVAVDLEPRKGFG